MSNVHLRAPRPKLRLRLLRGRRVVHEKCGCALEDGALGTSSPIRSRAGRRSRTWIARRRARTIPPPQDIGVYAARARTRPAVLFGLARSRCGEARQARPVVVSQFVDKCHRMIAVAARPRGLGRRSEGTETDRWSAWAFIDNHQIVFEHNRSSRRKRPSSTPGQRAVRFPGGQEDPVQGARGLARRGTPGDTVLLRCFGRTTGRKNGQLDGSPLNGISLCERDGYHNGRIAKSVAPRRWPRRTCARAAAPCARGRLPPYFLWTFLDLKSVGYGVEWRGDPNFPSNPRSWKNGRTRSGHRRACRSRSTPWGR